MSMDSSGVGELRIMSCTAFLVFMFTVFITVTVCTKPTQYFVERGADAKISCDFGNGQIRNLYWQYVSGSDLLNILTYFKGEITKGEGYSDRVELAKDISTLIIRDIALADEGLYQCDVDRNNNTGVVDLYSELIVFVQPFEHVESAPSILECIQTPSPTPCEHRVTAESASNLTCTLSGFYPQDIATLEWRHEGNMAKQTPAQPLENEDGTFDLTRTIFINISQSDVYVCIASFRSTEGVKTANASISVTDLGAYEMNDTPKNNVGLILGLIFGLVMIIIVSIIVAAVYRKKRQKNERQGGFRLGQEADNDNETNTPPTNSAGDTNETTNEENQSFLTREERHEEPNSNERATTSSAAVSVAGSTSTETPTPGANNSVPPSAGSSPTKTPNTVVTSSVSPSGGSHQANGAHPSTDTGTRPSNDSHTGNEVTQDQIEKLAQTFPHGKYTRLCQKLGCEYDVAMRILVQYNNDFYKALLEVLNDWKVKTGGDRAELVKALKNADAGGLCKLVE